MSYLLEGRSICTSREFLEHYFFPRFCLRIAIVPTAFKPRQLRKFKSHCELTHASKSPAIIRTYSADVDREEILAREVAFTAFSTIIPLILTILSVVKTLPTARFLRPPSRISNLHPSLHEARVTREGEKYGYIERCKQ